MNTSLVPKKFENKILGVTVTCYKHIDNTNWFNGDQVGALLGFSKPEKAIMKHVKPKHVMKTNDGKNLISEPGFWKLAIKFQSQASENFTDWICEEVIPSIRKEGRYELPGPLEAIKSITHGDIKALCWKDRKFFRRISKEKSDLAKDGYCVERGRRGGKSTQDGHRATRTGYYTALTRNTELRTENKELKTKNENLVKGIDDLIAGFEKLSKNY